MIARLDAWIRTAPDVPALASLGVRGVEDFLAEPGRLEGSTLARAETVAGSARGPSGNRKPGPEELRYPLPGTPDADGRQHERPMGAGTGWLRLFRWSRGGGELWRARFTRPRSTSLAERAWNVACHAAGHGVGVPELVAVGAGGRGLVARRSFLVVREPSRSMPLTEWAALEMEDEPRERGLRALAGFAERLAAAGIAHEGLEPRDLWIERPREGCGEAPVAGATAERNRLPGVLLVRLDGARLARPGDGALRDRALAVMDRALDGALASAFV